MKKIENKELKQVFENLKNNKPNSFEDIYTRYNKLVYKIAFSILKNNEDSEDVTQNVFSKIHELEKDNFPTKNEASWLYTVTKNEAISLLKKKRCNLELNTIYEIEDMEDSLNEIIDKDYYNKLISNLPKKQQEIISLKVLSDLSFEQISKLLNEPVGTIKWRYYKSVRSLKLLLTNLGMFIITFVIGIKTLYSKKKADNVDIMENIDKDQVKEEQNEMEDTKAESMLKNETLEKNNLIVDNTKNETKEEIVVLDSINLRNNSFGVGMISVSFVFLILTIIFLIFFRKSQLKLGKKISK